MHKLMFSAAHVNTPKFDPIHCHEYKKSAERTRKRKNDMERDNDGVRPVYL